jgi:hypothetical protein
VRTDINSIEEERGMGCWQERKGKRKKEREARKMVDKGKQ